MTSDEVRVDPNLLEDGEHVLWAVGNLKPNKKRTFPKWAHKLLIIFYYISLGGLFVLSWQAAKNVRDLPHFIRQNAVLVPTVILILGISNWLNRKGKSLKQQSEYYVGLITSQRLVLYSASREQDIVIRPGEVIGIKRDYSNGAPALKLTLTTSAPLPNVTIATAGDLGQARSLIENGFMNTHYKSDIMGRPHDPR